MRVSLPILVVLTGSLLLHAKWLSAQEYQDLWRSPDTDNFYRIQKKFNEHFASRDKGRGTGYKQFKRWEDFMEPRVYPSGKLINPAKLALDEELRYQGRTGNTIRRTAHAGNWTSLGIKNYITRDGRGGMGRVNCIVPHPTDPQTLFVGTPAGGIWKTTDGGSSWIPLSDGIPVIGVSGIAINPVYPDSIYILTGDGDGGHTPSIGVLLSVNGGDTWQSTGLQWDASRQRRGYKLLMHPLDRKILFVACNAGIFKTVDAGITWSGNQDGLFMDIAFALYDPTSMYATTANSVFVSGNTGDNWSEHHFKIETETDRLAIGVTSANPAYVYILAGSATGFAGLYRAVDGGDEFELRSNSPNILGKEIRYPFDNSSQSYYDLAIAVSPDNADEVHIGGINNWKSTDGGITWNYTSDWRNSTWSPGHYTHGDTHAMLFIGNTLYCGTDGGVYISKDHAGSWSDISTGLEITQFYRIGAPAGNSNIIYGGAQDNGINKWTAPNTTMEHQLGGDGMECVVDYTDENTVYAFDQRGQALSVTHNGGSWWTEYKKPSEANGRFVVPLIMNPANNTVLYAGYDAIYKITDTEVSKVFTAISPVFESSCVALAMSPVNSNLLYAATPQSLRFCAYTNTSSVCLSEWIDITDGLPASEAAITAVTTSALNAKKVWVSFSGYSPGKKVYMTPDWGYSWINISGSLPNVPVNCIVYHNNGKDGIYIGTDIGVFYRDNTMTDWMPFRNGMPNAVVNDLEITNDKIRAGTFGRGIWEFDLYDRCTNDFLIVSGDVTGYQILATGDGIESIANIKGGIGTSVQYKAATIISLENGFRVVPQSGFKASIDDCSSSILASRSSREYRRYRGVYEGVMSGALGTASIANSISLSLPANRLKVYPNPFSRQSTIEFYIPKQTAVNISLWDLSGKRIKVLFESQQQSPGNYQVRLDAAELSNGVYFIRLHTWDYQETKKIIITK